MRLLEQRRSSGETLDRTFAFVDFGALPLLLSAFHGLLQVREGLQRLRRSPCGVIMIK
jgi:hypothetical protein